MTLAEPSKTAGDVDEVTGVLEEEDGLTVLETIAGATVWEAPEALDETVAAIGDADSWVIGFAEPFSELEVLGDPVSGNFELEAVLSWSDNG